MWCLERPSNCSCLSNWSSCQSSYLLIDKSVADAFLRRHFFLGTHYPCTCCWWRPPSLLDLTCDLEQRSCQEKKRTRIAFSGDSLGVFQLLTVTSKRRICFVFLTNARGVFQYSTAQSKDRIQLLQLFVTCISISYTRSLSKFLYSYISTPVIVKRPFLRDVKTLNKSGDFSA